MTTSFEFKTGKYFLLNEPYSLCECERVVAFSDGEPIKIVLNCFGNNSILIIYNENASELLKLIIKEYVSSEEAYDEHPEYFI